jgi:hypothetical protein
MVTPSSQTPFVQVPGLQIAQVTKPDFFPHVAHSRRHVEWPVAIARHADAVDHVDAPAALHGAGYTRPRIVASFRVSTSVPRSPCCRTVVPGSKRPHEPPVNAAEQDEEVIGEHLDVGKLDRSRTVHQ